MLVYFFPKVKEERICIFCAIVFYIAGFFFKFGYLSGSEIESVYSFKPEMCSVQPSNGTSWHFYSQLNSVKYLGCNESLRNLVTSNMGEYYVEFSYPFSLDNQTLLAADWIERLTAVLVFRQDYEAPLDDPTLDFEAELMFFNRTSNENKWKSLASTKETRHIQCSFRKLFKKYIYGCTIIPIFELSSVDYDKYLLNIRFRGTLSRNMTYISEMNHLDEMRLVLRHEHTGFSRVMADMKICFLPIMLLAHKTYAKNHCPVKTVMESVLWYHSVVAVVVNVPFEYFWKWFRDPIWTHFATMAEVMFQTSLFVVWMFVINFFCYNGRPPKNIACYRWYILALLVWFSLTAYDEYYRWAVQNDPFFSSWGNYITAFKELAVYDFVRSLVTLLTGFFVAYQFYSRLSAAFMKKSLLLHHFGKDGWFDVSKSTAHLLATFLFGCVALAILQFSQNLLRKIHWKAQYEDSLLKYLLSPNLFTLFLGLANVLSIALLELMPKLNVNKNGNKLELRIFRDLNEFKDHVLNCCLHSQERITFCQQHITLESVLDEHQKEYEELLDERGEEYEEFLETEMADLGYHLTYLK